MDDMQHGPLKLSQRNGKACWMRIGGGTRPASIGPRKKGKLAGCGSGVGCVQQVIGPARRESLLVVDRGRDASNKSQTPQEEKACWMRIGGGTRPTSLRPRKEGKHVGCGSGLGRVQQESDPARRESLPVADRGWDASSKCWTPQEEKACRSRIGGGTSFRRETLTTSYT